MSVTVGQILTSAYRRMGAKSSDPEYPESQMVLYTGLAVAELHADCAKLAFGDVLLVRGRALAATGTRTYAFAEQDPPITSLLQVRRVRLAGSTESLLVPCSAEDLSEVDGYAYALTGPDNAAILYTSDSLPASAALTIDYTEGPPSLSSTNDNLPAWLPDQYRDVVELMVAEMALPQGSESRLADALKAKLEDRRAQLWTHWSARTPGAVARRM